MSHFYPIEVYILCHLSVYHVILLVYFISLLWNNYPFVPFLFLIGVSGLLLTLILMPLKLEFLSKLVAPPHVIVIFF